MGADSGCMAPPGALTGDVADFATGCDTALGTATTARALARSGVGPVAVADATTGAAATAGAEGAGVDSNASSARRADRLSSIRSTIAPGATLDSGWFTELSAAADAGVAGGAAATAAAAGSGLGVGAEALWLAVSPRKASGLACIQNHPPAPAATSKTNNPIQTQRRDGALDAPDLPDTDPMVAVPWRRGACGETGLPDACAA